MEKKFWLGLWEREEIGFHIDDVNPLLLKHYNSLELLPESRVFIPLCGKTLDIQWLLSKGYKVVGIELIEIAIEQLFEDLSITPTITTLGNLKKYSAENIDVFVGDFFKLTRELLGTVDVIYDRGALVALPEEMRINYTSHLLEVSDRAPQLLINFEYDQNKMAGPPFSISLQELNSHYKDFYSTSLLDKTEISGKFGSTFDINEQVWLLTPQG